MDEIKHMKNTKNIFQTLCLIAFEFILLLSFSSAINAKEVNKNINKASVLKTKNQPVQTNHYQFPTNLKFYHEDTFAQGTTESFSLYSNKDVKLLISMYAGKSLYQDTKKLTKNDISAGFLASNKDIDEVRNILNRQITDLQIQDNGQTIKILTTYSYQKSATNYVEKTVYLVGNKNFATAAISYPNNQSTEIQNLIDQGIKSFSFKNTQQANYNFESDKFSNPNDDNQFAQVIIDFDMQNVVSKYLSNSKLNSASVLISTANADANNGMMMPADVNAPEKPAVNAAPAAAAAQPQSIDCNTEINVSDYIISGEHQSDDGGTGKALYNFEFIKEGLLSKETSNNQKICLKKFFLEARNNSKNYWDNIFNKKCTSKPAEPVQNVGQKTDFISNLNSRMPASTQKAKPAEAPAQAQPADAPAAEPAVPLELAVENPEAQAAAAPVAQPAEPPVEEGAQADAAADNNQPAAEEAPAENDNDQQANDNAIVCPDAVASEFKRSTDYLDAIQKKLTPALADLDKIEGNICVGCAAPVNAPAQPAVAAAVADIAKNSCCSKDGPLSSFIKQTDEITDDNELQKQCLAKSGNSDKSLLSGQGIFECAKNAWTGLKDIWSAAKGLWSGIKSIFDGELKKSIEGLYANQNDWSEFGKKVTELLTKSITDEYESVFSCMNGYAVKQYMCRTVGQTITAFVAGAGILKVVKYLKNPAQFVADAKKFIPGKKLGKTAATKSTPAATATKSSAVQKLKSSASKVASKGKGVLVVTKTALVSLNKKFRDAIKKPFSMEFRKVVSSKNAKSSASAGGASKAVVQEEAATAKAATVKTNAAARPKGASSSGALRQKISETAEQDVKQSGERLASFNKKNEEKIRNIDKGIQETKDKLEKGNLDAHDQGALNSQLRLLEKSKKELTEKRAVLENDLAEKTKWAEKVKPSQPSKPSNPSNPSNPSPAKTANERYVELAERDLQASRQKLLDFDQKNKENISRLAKDRKELDEKIASTPDNDSGKQELLLRRESMKRVQKSFDEDRKKLVDDFNENARKLEHFDAKPEALKRKATPSKKENN